MVQQAAIERAEKHRLEETERNMKAQALAIVNQLAKAIK